VAVEQVCNETCRAKQPQTVLDKNGSLSVYDPVKNVTKAIDPST